MSSRGCYSVEYFENKKKKGCTNIKKKCLRCMSIACKLITNQMCAHE